MSQLTRNIVASFVGKGWTTVLSLVSVPLYIKFMGIEAYGLIGFFAILQSVLNLLDMGLGTASNRELARLSVQANAAQTMRDLVRTLEYIYWGAVGVIVTMMSLLTPWIAASWVKPQYLDADTVQHAVLTMGLVIACKFPYTLYTGGLLGLQRQVLFNALEVITETIGRVGAIGILLLISPTIQAFFVWQMFISLMQTSLAAISLWKSLPKTNIVPRFQKKLLLDMWRFAASMTGISVFAMLLTQLDKVILSKLLTLEMFGYYNVAMAIASGLYMITTPFFTAIFPRLSQLVSLEDEKDLKILYHRSCQWISVLIFPISVVIVLFPREIIFLWTGNIITAEKTHALVSLLIIGTALNSLMKFPYALQLAYGWTNLIFYTNIVYAIILVPLTFFMTVHYGAIGAAWCWIMLNGGYVFITVHIMHCRLLKNEKWYWYFIDVVIPLLAAVNTVGIWRYFVIFHISAHVILLYLISILVSTFFITVLFTPHTRLWALNQIAKLKVAYGIGTTSG